MCRSLPFFNALVHNKKTAIEIYDYIYCVKQATAAATVMYCLLLHSCVKQAIAAVTVMYCLLLHSCVSIVSQHVVVTNRAQTLSLRLVVL
jgi:hypothetical protein